MTFYTESSDGLVTLAASIDTGWSEPVPGRELNPLKSSAFHGALLRKLSQCFGYTARAMNAALQDNVAFSFRRLGLAAWNTLRNHREIAVRNRAALICLCATFAVLLWIGVYRGMRQAIGYLLAVWLSAFFTDLLVLIRPEQAVGFPAGDGRSQHGR